VRRSVGACVFVCVCVYACMMQAKNTIHETTQSTRHSKEFFVATTAKQDIALESGAWLIKYSLVC